jgi:hypothetical protein
VKAFLKAAGIKAAGAVKSSPMGFAVGTSLLGVTYTFYSWMTADERLKAQVIDQQAELMESYLAELSPAERAALIASLGGSVLPGGGLSMPMVALAIGGALIVGVLVLRR